LVVVLGGSFQKHGGRFGTSVILVTKRIHDVFTRGKSAAQPGLLADPDDEIGQLFG